jgi:hypothetical protein
MKVRRIIFLLMLTMMVAFSLVPAVSARPLRTFTPPSNITLHTYWLTEYGARRLPFTQCATGHTRWGCTVFCNEGGYPCLGTQIRSYPYYFNPVSIPIETDYLLDVIPREISVDVFHPNSIQAQAIAARSYAYWHIRAGSTINNSTEYQAFIPYGFEALNLATDPDNSIAPCSSTNLNASQARVCLGVMDRYYISYGSFPDDDLPALSEFFADIPNRTLTGQQSYELSVADPISSNPAIIQDGHGRGMSQKGASRWSYGNMGFQGNLDPWSVQWENYKQILVHYYSGINLRDANDSNSKITSAYRWNPLQISGIPTTIFHGQTYPISIQVQNTSESVWTCGYPNFTYQLKYRWAKAGHTEVTGTESASLCGQAIGDPSPIVTININNIPAWGTGAYTLRFDVYVSSTSSFWFSDQKWSIYNLSVCVDEPCKVYAPFVTK